MLGLPAPYRTPGNTPYTIRVNLLGTLLHSLVVLIIVLLCLHTQPIARFHRVYSTKFRHTFITKITVQQSIDTMSFKALVAMTSKTTTLWDKDTSIVESKKSLDLQV